MCEFIQEILNSPIYIKGYYKYNININKQYIIFASRGRRQPKLDKKSDNNN